jgi:hypothetical protein
MLIPRQFLPRACPLFATSRPHLARQTTVRVSFASLVNVVRRDCSWVDGVEGEASIYLGNGQQNNNQTMVVWVDVRFTGSLLWRRSRWWYRSVVVVDCWLYPCLLCCQIIIVYIFFRCRCPSSKPICSELRSFSVCNRTDP